MQGVRIDMAGQRFGRLLVLHAAESRDGRAYWTCSCDCGREAVVRGKYLRNGRTRSCGCLHRQMTSEASRTHGLSDSPTYRTYSAMMSRCTNPNQLSYDRYGARGVIVCERWKTGFAAFLEDMGIRPAGKTLERRNPFGNYEKANCFWATPEEQARNRRGDVALAVIDDLIAAGHGHLVQQAFDSRFGAGAHSPANSYSLVT